jgi:hypothetical protein
MTTRFFTSMLPMRPLLKQCQIFNIGDLFIQMGCGCIHLGVLLLCCSAMLSIMRIRRYKIYGTVGIVSIPVRNGMGLKSMDRLRLMETFVRVVETGNFSAVARQANTTQSAISKQVQALEADVGVLLLVRSTRSHALTEAGRLYYQRCRQVLDTLEEGPVLRCTAQNTRSVACCVSLPLWPLDGSTLCRAWRHFMNAIPK